MSKLEFCIVALLLGLFVIGAVLVTTPDAGKALVEILNILSELNSI